MSLIFDQIASPRDDNHVTVSGDEELGAAIDASLDELLDALELHPFDDHRFTIEPSDTTRASRVFGGRLLAQALVGASSTVVGKDVQSLHAAFVRAGTPGAALTVEVKALRDGGSMATREVAVLEQGEPLLVAIASFGNLHPGHEIAPLKPDATPPAAMPSLQDWAREVPGATHWIDHPPAAELRLPEAPSFLSGITESSTRSHWMRLPRSVGEEHDLNAALLAYASDFFLMDMIFRVHPDTLGPGRANGFSLDHAIWFHRPVRFDDWHLHTQEVVALVGDRGLARGTIHDAEGRCVASVAQEVLLRLGAAS
jgi:acyl-CoA thioesterase-2